MNYLKDGDFSREVLDLSYMGVYTLYIGKDKKVAVQRDGSGWVFKGTNNYFEKKIDLTGCERIFLFKPFKLKEIIYEIIEKNKN